MKNVNFDLEAKKIIDDGYVLALPTETVYGLGIRYDLEKAYERLCQVKGRRPDKAIAVMCSDKIDLDEYFTLNENAKKVISHFLPGPLTCLVKAKDNLPYQTHLGTQVAGLRIPDKEDLLEFLRMIKTPLQVTSANMSGSPALYTYEDVYSTFDNSADVKGIVKGTCDSHIPTTVVDLTSDTIKIIREGAISEKEILEVIKGK